MKVAIYSRVMEEDQRHDVQLFFDELNKQNLQPVIFQTFCEKIQNAVSLPAGTETFQTPEEITNEIEAIISLGGDGTLLDHSLVLHGTNMGNSNQHLHHDVPHVLIGGANGKLKGGRHLAYPSKTVPTGNLLLSILDLFDIHQDSIGDSTGRLENL